MVPAGVTFHTHRMRLHDAATPEGLAHLHADLDAAIAMLTPCGVDAVAYACTAGSMISPPERLEQELSARNDVACLTTSAAIVAALKSLGAKRLSVATPYARRVNEHETHFLADCGFEVARIEGLGIGEGGPHEFIRIAQTPLEQVAAHARACFVPGSDALLITCTDFPTLSLIDPLEAELGVPVVTSNQATLWAMLRAVGIHDRVPGAGRLLAGA
ncbi:aspartate/glutamate racemase family protein [Albimonas sp. CAU 1670]|uniref:maleate cis-trans isomerase family protein n=1 Tax=Albimonas sp. CAU 1670 TaxID=3032599 RepID=UPI0023DCE62B|nr:aspartate/glutamate racemase family protein [Albimonas sp. CAU 1670]MDF2231783.1 aspartate/glutamate racemase family protein [Albimonas sp. CAU 1670]